MEVRSALPALFLLSSTSRSTVWDRLLCLRQTKTAGDSVIKN